MSEADLISSLAAEVKELRRELKRLKLSDQGQWERLRAQHRWSMIFAGVVAVGAALSMNNLSPENRASLQDVAVGLAVVIAGGVGVAGTTSNRFVVARHSDDDADVD